MKKYLKNLWLAILGQPKRKGRILKWSDIKQKGLITIYPEDVIDMGKGNTIVSVKTRVDDNGNTTSETMIDVI